MNKKRIRNSIKSGKVAPFLPSVITTAGLCLGLLSIGVSVKIAAAGTFPNGDLAWRAAAFIAIAMVLDMLDGRVARALGIQNRFGFVYDSLSDTVCFGVAPALLVYALLGKSGFPVLNIGLLIYVVCVTLRLARFNTQSLSAEKKSFMGLPSPMAAGVMISPIFIAIELNAFPAAEGLSLFYSVLAPVTGFLMVSGIRYRKTGSFGFGRVGQRFDFLVTSAVLMAVVAINPGVSVAVVSALYLASPPLFFLLKYFKFSAAKGGNKSRSVEDPENKEGGGD